MWQSNVGDEVQSNSARCWGPLRQQWVHLVVPSLWSLKSKCPCNTMLLAMNCKLFTPKKKEECPCSPCCWPSLHFQQVPTGWCPLSLAESTTLFIGSSEGWMWPWFWGHGQQPLCHARLTAPLCTGCCTEVIPVSILQIPNCKHASHEP